MLQCWSLLCVDSWSRVAVAPRRSPSLQPPPRAPRQAAREMIRVTTVVVAAATVAACRSGEMRREGTGANRQIKGAIVSGASQS